jgi:hypothetical protein
VQLAEYAEARAEQAAEAARAARAALEAAGGGGAGGSAGGNNAALSALCASLHEAADEAAVFATQQRQDADRLQQQQQAAGGSGAGAAGAAAAAAGEAGAGGEEAAAAAEEAEAAGDGKRRGGGATGGKRRSGGTGSADPKRRGSANGRAAAGAAGASGGGGGNKGDDESLHSAISEPASGDGGGAVGGAGGGRSTTTTTSTTPSSDDGDSSDDDDDDDGGNPRAPGAFRRRDLVRAQRALAAAADPQDSLVSIKDRSRHVPLRLKLEDRRLLRLLEAALQVSEYVDRVDVLTWRSRASRASAQVRDLCAILSGLVVAQDYRAGQRLVADRDFAANAAFFQDVSLGGGGGGGDGGEEAGGGGGESALAARAGGDLFFAPIAACPSSPLVSQHSHTHTHTHTPHPILPPLNPPPPPKNQQQQQTFEIGRRYKIMNPDKMRDTFGKLMYVLMDAQTPDVQELLEFPLVRPLQTVWSFLEQRLGPEGAALFLDDPLVPLATAEIPSGPNRARAEVQRDIRAKERAREQLSRRYSSPERGLSSEDLLWCLYSIADNNSFLLFNRDPIDRLLRYFYAAFPEGSPPVSPELSLAICAGKGGARLTHSHARQWGFVQQSLTLWREIMHDMFRLYSLAEGDMLMRGQGYRLADTGQGLNRVQPAPSVARAMAGIVQRVQRRCGSWIGSSVVHMGDHNVPNALFFLDKYMQVPRILNPVVSVLDGIPPLCNRDKSVREYVQATFGGVEQAQRLILADFCRHAFDGSGADNAFDAGSCVDGRLTAAWNWANKIEKKSYAPLFRLSGWSGFDGSFRE